MAPVHDSSTSICASRHNMALAAGSHCRAGVQPLVPNPQRPVAEELADFGGEDFDAGRYATQIIQRADITTSLRMVCPLQSSRINSKCKSNDCS